MGLAALRRNRRHEPAGVLAVARVDARTKDLTRRLRHGDVAVIDHLDLDRVSADALVRCGVAAVVNASASISGRYPNLGPGILVQAGIALVDGCGPDVLTALRDGDRVRLHGDRLYRRAGNGDDEELIATGTVQTAQSVAGAMAEARKGLAVQLEAFAINTMEYLQRERTLLLDGVGVPQLRTKMAGRHALVVVRGYDYREDLAALRSYIREHRPVLVGVDGGADALREAGYRPDLIVGDMDSVSDAALRCGAELVVHAYSDGRAPGLRRVQTLGLTAVVFPAAATSEDVALLLADEMDAALIVAVGTHATLVEFLDKGRAGMASTFLTRLRLGGKLVDAKGVSRLYRSRIGSLPLMLLMLAAFVTLSTALALSGAAQVYLDLAADKWHSFLFWLWGVV